MIEGLTDTAYAAGWSTVRRLPEPAARRLFRTIADQAWLRHGSGVRQLERNLGRVVPEANPQQLRRLSRAGMRSYLRYWSEVFRLPDRTPEQIVTSFRIYQEENLVDALKSGRGAVVSLPHMGNWDHAGAWATLAHAPLTTVAERLKPESLYERFLDFRRGLGMEVLPLTGGAPPFRTLLTRAREGGLIALLGDRDLTKAGVPVSLFGEPTRMPAGPAALALGSGAALLPATLWYEDGYSCARIHDPVDPPSSGTRSERAALMTQAVADQFAGGIREHPQDWHMLQRLWLADLQPGRAEALDAADREARG